MEWISAKKYLPGNDINYVIVRVISKNHSISYHEAIYKNGWNFINFNRDDLQITHWLIPNKVPEPDFFESPE